MYAVGHRKSSGTQPGVNVPRSRTPTQDPTTSEAAALRKVKQVTQFQEDAKTELATAMVMAPEDLLNDVGPLAQLWFLNQVAWHVARSMTGMMSSDASAELEDEDPPVVALQELMQAVGILDQTCLTMGLLTTESVTAP